MNIMSYREFKELYGLSDRMARRILNTEGCPLLPRRKNESYWIPQKPFEEWFEEEFIRR